MGGILLGAYLLLLLSATNIGQARLHKSQLNELNLKVINYAESLSYIFNIVKEDTAYVAKHKTSYTYFANLASGMSMKYGLGSSLVRLKRNLVQHTQVQEQHNSAILFDRMLLVGKNAKVIADSHPTQPFDVNSLSLDTLLTKSKQIDVVENKGELLIRTMHNVYYNDEVVGIVIGYVNNNLVEALLGHQKHSSSKSRIALDTSVGLFTIWDSLTHSDVSVELDNQNLIYFDMPIAGTPFVFAAWFESVADNQIITSTWFTVALYFLAVPVVIGFVYSIRVSNANLILKTKYQETQKQQGTLTKQNERLKTEIQRRKEFELELEHQATHDALTGLTNRKSADDQLRKVLFKAEREQQNALLLFIDLDNFKQINDTLGHLAGDDILKQAAYRLKESVRKSDVVARIGGDEFLLIIPELNSEFAAKELAANLLKIFEQPFFIKETEFYVSSSIGLALYPKDGDTADILLAHADTAMYRAKEQGRNGFSFYDESMNKDVQRNLDIDARLRQITNSEDINVYYQPVICLKTKKIVGAEALMRWQDEKLGFVRPDEFIPIAEKNGLIHKLGEIAITKACCQTAKWHDIYPMNIAVNFSSVQFRRPKELFESILNALNKSGLDAKYLDVEITESLLFHHNLDTLNLINNLKAMGANLSIDDFGTGYSALSYLQEFPFDKLKIDRSFLMSMETNQASKELVNAIIAMAKSLGLKVVAEGVESKWDQDYLSMQECEFAQGYYYSRPVPSEDFEKLLRESAQVV